MNILDTIIVEKKKEVEQKKRSLDISELEKGLYFKRKPISFTNFLSDKNKTGIIAEFKRKSPSKGIINSSALVEDVILDYVKFGASAVSVLTDEIFFGGSLEDLKKARVHDIPVLRKEFIVDEYQILESKAFGADIILLIAACLTKDEVKEFAHFAKNIGLNVLLEIHTENELEHINDDIDVVGINNRDLKTFKVDLEHSIEMCGKIPSDKYKISESGIDNVKTINYLKQNGFGGFLMGEKFMREKNPGKAFADFINELQGS
ncbi:MAG: indole-3-glycerol phosphate synthase TrpC [Ginsengibacter sp.]